MPSLLSNKVALANPRCISKEEAPDRTAELVFTPFSAFDYDRQPLRARPRLQPDGPGTFPMLAINARGKLSVRTIAPHGSAPIKQIGAKKRGRKKVGLAARGRMVPPSQRQMRCHIDHYRNRAII